MTPLAYVALLGWIPIVIFLFALIPARNAAAIAVIGGWLFLPPFTLLISSLPDYSKITAAGVGIMLGTLFFSPDRFLKFRPRWFDVPMLLWCLTGILTSIQNGLGLYDGLSNSLNQTLTWGLPYLFGRIYFGTPEDLRYFVVGMTIGGLIYVPPCIWEMRMSPMILANTYGALKWGGTRLGGYRPRVFFPDGLELGMWMTAASLAAWWLWRCGALKKIGAIPFGLMLLPILLVTTVLCRSTGALALLAGGMILLWLSDRFKTRLLLAGVLLTGPVYVGVRATNLWSGQQAVDLATVLVGPERAESLGYRFMCETLILERALQQPVFGWGEWDRGAVYFDKERKHHVPTDGLWIIILGFKGFVGLILFYVSFVLPAVLFLWRFPARSLGDPRLAAGWLAVGFLDMYLIDCLLNSFPNIIYMTLAGGLISLEPRQLRAMSAPRRGNEAAGRRAATSGIEMPGAGPHPGRRAEADRCRTLGRSFKQEGRLDEAEAAWRQALDVLGALLEADPGCGELQRRWCDCANDLAWLRANHPDPARRDPISAVAMARRAVDVCPNAAAYWNTLGVAHYRACDDHSAVAAFDRATALGGGTAFDDVFLAMAHARLGDLVEARQELARAMLQAEREFPGHPELAGFCDEAQSILTGVADTPAATR